MTSTGYRRNSLRGGGEREDGGGRLIVETIKGRRGRGGKGGGGCNAGGENIRMGQPRET